MSGPAGIWGPSCISCAQVAVSEINEADGIGNKRLVPYFLDADDGNIDALEQELATLISEGEIEAVVGMHLSSVRQRLKRVISGRIPYVFTPAYEGNENAFNVYAIGEKTSDQLAPAIRYLSTALKARRWALIGNEYVWPRQSHVIARSCIAEVGGTIVFEDYVPLGFKRADRVVERIARTKPDITIVSLIGQDAVEFNRAFGARNLDRQSFRLSTAMDENVLLATGAQNTKRLFVASAYFSDLKTERNEEFKERYKASHRTFPPVLNALGQSLYEGLHFYATMRSSKDEDAAAGLIRYRSVRKGLYHVNECKGLTTYLSRADGHRFSILCELD